MIIVNAAECEAAGLDAAKVRQIAKGLSHYAKEARLLNLQVFGGSGTGTLRYDDGGDGELIIAYLDGSFDGGDGAVREDNEGLHRGESTSR